MGDCCQLCDFSDDESTKEKDLLNDLANVEREIGKLLEHEYEIRKKLNDIMIIRVKSK